jgi:hypothetical protein
VAHAGPRGAPKASAPVKNAKTIARAELSEVLLALAELITEQLRSEPYFAHQFRIVD